MKPIQVILIGGCIIVFLLDALSSIASRRFNFNYARLAPLSFIIYTMVGFLGTRASDQTSGIIVAAAVGFFDATAGWKISMVLKANTGKVDNNPSVSRWISTAVFVTLLAAICGLVGSEVSRLMR
jgi:hypothetical protein